MIPIQDVLNRIRWDPEYAKARSIPYRRIRAVYRDDELIWARPAHVETNA